MSAAEEGTAPPWVPGRDQQPRSGGLSLAQLVGRPGVRGARPALVLDGHVRSHRDLADRARAAAAALLQRHQLRPGDRVLLSARNRLEYYEAEIALGAAGLIMVAVSWRNTVTERVDLLVRSGAALALADSDFAIELVAARDRGGFASGVPVLAFTATDGVDGSYEELVAAGAGPGALPETRLEDPHEIIYTSGTTGRPKGAVWTQGTVLWNAMQQAIDFGLRPEHSTYVGFDLNYIGGRHQFGWALLLQGGVVHLRASGGFDAREVLTYVVDHRITHVLWVPTMLYDILALGDVGEQDTSSLEMIMCGGAPLSEQTIRDAQLAFPHTRVVQVYGLTEGGGTVTVVPPDDVDRKVGSAGLPSLTNEIRIAEPDGSSCPAGTIGEVLVRGPSLMAGYWDDPGATAEAVRDGWLWTGDLGYLDDEGFLYLSGRRKELIISGGMNIFPREIEDVLRLHPAVRDAAVIGLPHPRWGESVCAVVELADGEQATAEELIEHCRGQLASYKKPTAVRFVASLPRTLSGKVRKAELTSLVSSGGAG